jgi:hypothetical protein
MYSHADVGSILQRSTALLNVPMAIGTFCSQQDVEFKLSRAKCLGFYGAAMSSLRADLLDDDLIKDSSVLWSTFFLGIFEVRSSRCDHILIGNI